MDYPGNSMAANVDTSVSIDKARPPKRPRRTFTVSDFASVGNACTVMLIHYSRAAGAAVHMGSRYAFQTLLTVDWLMIS
jgi:hypothetical protein